MSWGAFLAAIAGPLVRKVLVSLGIGMVTMVGLGVVQDAIDAAVGDAWTGISADVYQVLALGGWVDAVAWWIAAIAAVIAWLSMPRLGSLPTGGSGA